MTPRTTGRLGLLVLVLVAVLALLLPLVLRSGTATDSAAPPTSPAPDTSVVPTPAPMADADTPPAPPRAEPSEAPAVLPVADAGRAPGEAAPVDPVVEQAVADGGTTPVIVGLDVPEGLAPEARAVAVAAAADQVLAGLPAGSYSAVKPTGAVPALALTVDADGLDALRTSAPVDRVAEDGVNYPTSMDSTASIGATQVWPLGVLGTGSTVAVLDTGVAGAHPFLADGLNPGVIAEACFSTTSSLSASTCPDGQLVGPSLNGGNQYRQVGPGAAAPCTTSTQWCRHGTHVAGIAAGGSGLTSLTSGLFQASGVAPGANIVAVQVFSTYKPSTTCETLGNCSIVAFDSDIISALEWLHENRASFPQLAAVNLSLGGGRYAPGGSCDDSFIKPAIDDLRAVGIATVVAAGNDGYRGYISTPGCISSAVGVGAVDDATMTVASYSNVSADVDLLAPGSSIWSSLPATSMGYMSGTSMATPAVTGVFGVLHQLRPDLSVSEALALLQGTGAPVATGLSAPAATLPYVQLSEAVAALSPPPEASFNAMEPVRVLDTRTASPIGPGQSRTVDAALAAVPADATAVVANITATEPTADGYLTAFPGAVAPTASNLNFSAGQTVPNLVTVKLDGQGRFQLFNKFGKTHAIVDIVGWYRPGSGAEINPVAPKRVLDTRSEGGPVVGGTTRRVDATRAGVPVGATAVVANVTVTDPTAPSFLTAYPGGTRPNASNLNFLPDQTVPNLVTVKLAVDGSFVVYNHTGRADVVVDVVGWFGPEPGGEFTPIAPKRVTDTRLGLPLGPSRSMTVDPTTVGVPVGATAVVANVTVTNPTSASYLTAYPGGTPPTASNLNFVAGQTVPNLVTVKLDGTGRFKVFNQQGNVDVVVDVVGWYQ